MLGPCLLSFLLCFFLELLDRKIPCVWHWVFHFIFTLKHFFRWRNVRFLSFWVGFFLIWIIGLIQARWLSMFINRLFDRRLLRLLLIFWPAINVERAKVLVNDNVLWSLHLWFSLVGKERGLELDRFRVSAVDLAENVGEVLVGVDRWVSIIMVSLRVDLADTWAVWQVKNLAHRYTGCADLALGYVHCGVIHVGYAGLLRVFGWDLWDLLLSFGKMKWGLLLG